LTLGPSFPPPSSSGQSCSSVSFVSPVSFLCRIRLGCVSVLALSHTTSLPLCRDYRSSLACSAARRRSATRLSAFIGSPLNLLKVPDWAETTICDFCISILETSPTALQQPVSAKQKLLERRSGVAAPTLCLHSHQHAFISSSLVDVFGRLIAWSVCDSIPASRGPAKRCSPWTSSKDLSWSLLIGTKLLAALYGRWVSSFPQQSLIPPVLPQY
jgi:hypothetical protein